MKQLFVVGIGPGSFHQMTGQAVAILTACEAIVGYTVYIDLIRAQFPDKEFLTTPMKQEVDRCLLAFEKARKGKTTAVVCSGDAGVYGMAGLILELGVKYPDVSVEIIPGISACIGGAALLGAPLMHDFAVISLSDLLTPLEKIDQRIKYAAAGDFCICLYNPSSRKRAGYLKRACELIAQTQPLTLVCGLARQIGREGEQTELLTLKELMEASVDMFTTVFIGNSQTKELNGKMVTPRGYRIG